MGSQPESQQYNKKPQVPPAMPAAKESDFQKQGVDQGKKAWPAVKEKDDEPGADPDDTSPQSE